MRRGLCNLYVALGLLASLVSAACVADGRHLAIIIDTSGSMTGSDRPRYTVQLSQILADLLDNGDSLTVIRLPLHEGSCADGANPALAVQRDAADRGGFQQKLEQLLAYGGDNNFAAPVHTAQADLQRHKDQARLLLFIADSGGLGRCDRELTQDLSRLRGEGVMIAAINIGGPGAFDANPAFAFTTGARDSEDLAKAVAQVYQKFIGVKQVQTGRVQQTIEFDIGPLVKDAYLVVAADGQMAALEPVAGNPSAEQLDLNHKGGGHTNGLDGRRRDYRIVHLRRPAAGHWRFQVPALKDPAGWMLLQDSALGLRLVSSPQVAQGIATPLEVELYDQNTGKRISDGAGWPGLQASVEIEGQTLALRDDGQGGDRQAGDGIFTAQAVFQQTGPQRIRLNAQNDQIDRQREVEVHVESVGWILQVSVPPHVEVETPAFLSVTAQANPAKLSPVPLQAIEVSVDGKTQATLRDDGKDGDQQAGDKRYSGTWTPKAIGDFTLRFNPLGGSKAQPVSASLNVVGSVKFAEPIPVKLGRTGSNSELPGRLELGPDTRVKGEFPLQLDTAYAASGSVLEIDLGAGWVALGSRPLPLSLSQTGPRVWPLRLRVGDCPAGVSAADRFTIEFTGMGADGQPLRHSVPLTLEIVADPWLHCWWPVLAAALAALAAGFVFYGFWSPSRFSPRLGVMLSPEEDIGEGFFHPIRAQRGTGSGFYRDARVYIRQDFCLSGRAKASLARLRADGKRVYIQPTQGMPVYRQNLDGGWDALPPEESLVHYGVIYKDAMGALFFEIRNG